jgi:hypothetical protein
MSTTIPMSKEMEAEREERHELEQGEKKLWPRDSFRDQDEKLGSEIERHLWPGKENVA